MPATQRTGYPGTIAALDAITAANNNKLPGGIIARNYMTTPATNVGAAGGSPDTFIQCAATLGDNRMIRVSLHCPRIEKGGVLAGRVKMRLLLDPAGGTSFTNLCTLYNDHLEAADQRSVDSFFIFDSGTIGACNFGVDVLVIADTGGEGGDVDTIAASTGGSDRTVSDPGPVILAIEDTGPWF